MEYKIEIRSVSELTPFSRNPYKHPEKQMAHLKKSIKEFGFTNPILVSSDDFIVAGHARLQAAKECGLLTVPTIKLDMGYQKAVAYVITDNQINKLAEEDPELMKELLQEIREYSFDSGFDIEATGFSIEDFDRILDNSILEYDPVIPADFAEFDKSISTDHKCPKCGYEWSGAIK